MPLYSLRTESDWGVGSYSDLGKLGRWLSSAGGSMLGGLPLYPTFLDPPADPSPYRPVSRLAYNEVYVDPTALPELARTPRAQQLLESDDFRQRIEAAHKSSLVEYEDVARLRRQVLEPMAQSLVSGDGDAGRRRREFDAFAMARPELVAYARFRAALEAGGRNNLPGPDVHAGESGGGRGGGGGDRVADLSPVAAYFLYCQWAAATQLTEAGAALAHYADFPVGVHPDGFDPYWYPASFVPGVSGGAPPDGFFAAGQEWGFPPLHPERIREDGYRYVIAALRRAMRHAGVLRIDHVMGLQHLYMIPKGFDALHGAYVSYRAQELHAIVSLEAHRAGTVVVGEDLGTVPAGVRERMAADQMLRSWVFQFESSSEVPLPDVPADVLASTGTHDLPRFGAYLWGADIDESEAAGRTTAEAGATQRAARARWRKALLRSIGHHPEGTSEAELTQAAFEACLEHLAVSAADLVLVDLEELWDERQPQNRPGTGPEAENWRHRSARTLGEAASDPRVIGLLSNLDHLRRGTT
jgi:4-alpha-glucanotransferase